MTIPTIDTLIIGQPHVIVHVDTRVSRWQPAFDGPADPIAATAYDQCVVVWYVEQDIVAVFGRWGTDGHDYVDWYELDEVDVDTAPCGANASTVDRVRHMAVDMVQSFHDGDYNMLPGA